MKILRWKFEQIFIQIIKQIVRISWNHDALRNYILILKKGTRKKKKRKKENKFYYVDKYIFLKIT